MPTAACFVRDGRTEERGAFRKFALGAANSAIARSFDGLQTIQGHPTSIYTLSHFTSKPPGTTLHTRPALKIKQITTPHKSSHTARRHVQKHALKHENL